MSMFKVQQSLNSLEFVAIKQNTDKIVENVRKTGDQHDFDHYRHKILANARVLYGSNRNLEIITVGSDSAQKVGIALVEYTPDGSTFVHAYFPGSVSRVDTMKQLLTMTEDQLMPMFANLQASRYWLHPTHNPVMSNGDATTG